MLFLFIFSSFTHRRRVFIFGFLFNGGSRMRPISRCEKCVFVCFWWFICKLINASQRNIERKILDMRKVKKKRNQMKKKNLWLVDIFSSSLRPSFLSYILRDGSYTRNTSLWCLYSFNVVFVFLSFLVKKEKNRLIFAPVTLQDRNFVSRALITHSHPSSLPSYMDIFSIAFRCDKKHTEQWEAAAQRKNVSF